MTDSPYEVATLVAVYDQITAPAQFASPARDLVEILRLSQGSIVLDVGTGTGVIARPALGVVGPKGAVVGTDRSIEMLRCARRAGSYPIVVARTPGLPFSSCTFDAVMAGFVLSHFSDYEHGLADMVRVCRPGGRVGVSAWGARPNPAAALWSQVAGLYMPRERLDQAFRDRIPWDEWFSRSENLERALNSAELVSGSVETREYRIMMPTPDYLLSREANVQGMVLRRALSGHRWGEFTRHVAEVFQTRFGGTVEYIRDVLFGVGTKPAV